MSTFSEQTRARLPRTGGVAPQRARLSVVGGGQRARRLPFAAAVIAVLGIGLVGLLVLNTSLQHQAFRARSLEQRADALTVRKQALVLRVEGLRAPDRVAHAAAALGMQPVRGPVFLFLADGTVRGEEQPAEPADALRLEPLRAAEPPGDEDSAQPRPQRRAD